MAAGKIFLCYRREDSAGHAGRIYDRLNQRFPGRVFMDVAGISVGSRWAEVIDQTLGACEAAVILIGRRWLERRPDGTRRIDDPQDSLRAEINTALRLKLKIVPLLVAGAAVPQESELPQDVAPILDWQALRIDDDDFDHDTSRLIQSLERQIKDRGTDLHLEPEAMKQDEIRRLMASAESCIARGDWLTAAQTLQSVLSLDKTHAEAAARLQFVQQQSARAYKPEPPPPPRGHSGLWKAFGALGILGGIAVAAVAVIVVMMVLAQRQDPSGPGPQPYDPKAEATPVTPYNDGKSSPPEDANAIPYTLDEAPAAPAMAGDYNLTSYNYQGLVVPSSGGLRLAPMSDGRFQFEMVVNNLAVSATFQYVGLLEGHEAGWAMTIHRTNDPTAIVGAPIATQVNFDGTTLTLENSYGQFATWQKYR